MLNLNGQLLPMLPESFALFQRAAFYGDGFFETIRAFSGKVPFWPLHWDRISKSLKVLGFETPAHWNIDYFKAEILRISPHNARIRLTVWRAPGGFYLPSDHSPEFLITAEPLNSADFDWLESGMELCLCESVKLPVDSLSGIKSLSSARYVAAARDAHSKGVQDAFILNAEGRICDTSSSNIFWIRHGVVYVPPLTDGQINGTLQRLLCRILLAEGIDVHEKQTFIADLEEADEVFLTNSIRGIRWVRKFSAVEYPSKRSFEFNQLLNEHLRSRLF